ncbi:MAG TPA: ABC transporter ATP-binding protein [Sedimentisphaerales bacterium]|nr:ABC transporter ATP-binding protein [Sedimentisphaerales bacterium]
MSGIIEVRNLSFGYTSKSAVLKDIGFAVPSRTFLGIVGPNGAGKSTLLNLMSGALKPRSGTITIDAAPIESYSAQELAARVAVVRQESVPIFGFSVMETVLMARTPYFGAAGFESQADRDIVKDALELTDTTAFASRPLTSLSSGERQRVFIARALAQNSPILLLDEPTSFLDLKHQVGIYDLLKAAQLEKGKTIVAVTHDINLACQYCDEALLLGTDNSYRHGPANEVLTAEQIKEVFDVRIFAGRVGQERFFMPLGKRAKDNAQTNAKTGKI